MSEYAEDQNKARTKSARELEAERRVKKAWEKELTKGQGHVAVRAEEQRLKESFRWLTGLDQFKTADAGKNSIRIKGVAARANDVSRNKPYPDPYFKGVELLGVPAENILVIEDNPAGVLSAKEAGCKVVAFPNSFTKNMRFVRADAVVSGLDKINDEFLYRLFNSGKVYK